MNYGDSIKQILSWAKNNMESSKQDNIHWVLDDALKFAMKEAKRGKLYNGIIMDPPTFGFGTNKERWKIELKFPELVKVASEILTKNIGLFAIACTMYMVYGYDLMYGGGLLLDGISGEGETYSNAADFYFQVVFVATAMSIVSGAVAERMKLFSFFVFAAIFDR